MSSENNKAVFSLRLPQELAREIDAEAKLNKRVRNSEIIEILETGLQLKKLRRKAVESVDADLLKTQT